MTNVVHSAVTALNRSSKSPIGIEYICIYWLMDFTVTFIHRSGAQPDSPIPTAETFLDSAVLSGDYKRVVQLKQSRALSDPEKHYRLAHESFCASSSLQISTS